MASNAQLLMQQKPVIEARLKTLFVPYLKEICRAYDRPVSGTKVILTGRCIEILDEIVRASDSKRFDEFRYRVNHHGNAPTAQNLDSPANAYPSPASGYSSHPMPLPRSANATAPSEAVNPTGYHFQASPFYEYVETVMPLLVLPDMPQYRHTVQGSITLSVQQAQTVERNSMQLLLYCGDRSHMSYRGHVEVAFPNQIEVKVNGDDVKHNYKGLKNKPGSTKPADVTAVLRKRPGYTNQLTVTYALTNRSFGLFVYMVRYVSPEALAERIKTGNIIPKQRVLDDMRRANADPDVAATSVRMSLRDPISTVRITLPVRSNMCTHNQCFDGRMFLELQEQAPQWRCPVCSRTVTFKSLCIDKYFEDILQRTTVETEKVDIEPSGEWRIIKEEESEQPGGTSREARAAYDDDFDDDDDLVDLTETTNKTVNGVKAGLLSPRTGGGFPMHTPPLSSREASVAQSAASAPNRGNKRPASAVIDLTLSDDEDEPPRPAQRLRPNASSPRLPPSKSLPVMPTSASSGVQLPGSSGRRLERSGLWLRPPSPAAGPVAAAVSAPTQPLPPSETQSLSGAWSGASNNKTNSNSNNNANWAESYSRPSSGFSADYSSPFAIRAMSHSSPDPRSPLPAELSAQPESNGIYSMPSVAVQRFGSGTNPAQHPQQQADPGQQTGWRSDFSLNGWSRFPSG